MVVTIVRESIEIYNIRFFRFNTHKAYNKITASPRAPRCF